MTETAAIRESAGTAASRKRRASAFSRVLLWTFLLGAVRRPSWRAGRRLLCLSANTPLPAPWRRTRCSSSSRAGHAARSARRWSRSGIISNGAHLRRHGASSPAQRSRLKAGEYEFAKRRRRCSDVMALIASGKAITYKISIPEGFTSEMAVARVNANEVLTGPPRVPPEGSILPDTYVFRRGMTRQKLVEDMQAAQAKLLDELWATRASRTGDRDQGAGGDARLHRREGNGGGGRAARHRLGLHQPAEEGHAAAVRPHHHLRNRGRQGQARPGR